LASDTLEVAKTRKPKTSTYFEKTEDADWRSLGKVVEIVKAFPQRTGAVIETQPIKMERTKDLLVDFTGKPYDSLVRVSNSLINLDCLQNQHCIAIAEESVF